MIRPPRLLLSCLLLTSPVAAGVFPGADENTPSYSHYFTWINNTNEGPTAPQTAANLEFFQWLQDDFGMVLDIYAFDAGAIGYTYFFPLDQSLVGKDIEVVLLGMKDGGENLQPSVWLTARDLPFTSTRVTLPR